MLRCCTTPSAQAHPCLSPACTPGARCRALDPGPMAVLSAALSCLHASSAGHHPPSSPASTQLPCYSSMALQQAHSQHAGDAPSGGAGFVSADGKVITSAVTVPVGAARRPPAPHRGLMGDPLGAPRLPPLAAKPLNTARPATLSGHKRPPPSPAISETPKKQASSGPPPQAPGDASDILQRVGPTVDSPESQSPHTARPLLTMQSHWTSCSGRSQEVDTCTMRSLARLTACRVSRQL